MVVQVLKHTNVQCFIYRNFFFPSQHNWHVKNFYKQYKSAQTSGLEMNQWKWSKNQGNVEEKKKKINLGSAAWEWDALLTLEKSLWGQKDVTLVWLEVLHHGRERRWASLLVLLAVCDGGHGTLAFVDVTDTGPLSVHWFLPQGHLWAKVNGKQCKWCNFFSSWMIPLKTPPG